ncbi:uncharacterized protein NPIL_475111 [Nephila pilipes]|uniref:Uncharacterized protein n=1 Tax=Nephila pilipes TaxID=299642 RepID=A0A8X6Q7E2_NEPPI|nr:uncharacterized protein NPIL_475111 [Nephila pilipes]
MTSQLNRLSKVAETKAAKILMNYFEGKNNKSLEISKTLPIRIKVSRPNVFLYEVSYMIPSHLTKDPPGPYDMKINLSQEEARTYVVRSFQGFYAEETGVKDEEWDDEAKKLALALKDDDTVNKFFYYKVQYDTPSLFTESNNEVWMIKHPE